MTDLQIDKLLAILDRQAWALEKQTEALEKLANAVAATNEELNIQHGDLASEIKILRRTGVLQTGLNLLQEEGLDYENLKAAVADANAYVGTASKTEHFDKRARTKYVNINFNEDLSIKMAHGESLLCGQWDPTAMFYEYNGVKISR